MARIILQQEGRHDVEVAVHTRAILSWRLAKRPGRLSTAYTECVSESIEQLLGTIRLFAMRIVSFKFDC